MFIPYSLKFQTLRKSKLVIAVSDGHDFKDHLEDVMEDKVQGCSSPFCKYRLQTE